MPESEKTISTVIAERRSTPRFAAIPVRDEDLKQIIIAGLESPSGPEIQRMLQSAHKAIDRATAAKKR